MDDRRLNPLDRRASGNDRRASDPLMVLDLVDPPTDLEPIESLPSEVHGVSATGRGVGIVALASHLTVVLTEPTGTGLRVVDHASIPREDDRWPIKALQEFVQRHGLRSVRPAVSLEPEGYEEEVFRVPRLRGRELRRWLAARRRNTPGRTVAHVPLKQTDDHAEVLKLSIDTREALRAVQACERAGLRQPRLYEPRLASVGRVGPALARGVSLVAELLPDETASLHLWRDDRLELFRPVRLPNGAGSRWEFVAREIVRTISYYREQSRGIQVDHVALVATGDAESAAAGVRRLQEIGGFTGLIDAHELPADLPGGSGLALNLACLRQPRTLPDLVPDVIRLRPVRRAVLIGQAALVVATMGAAFWVHRSTTDAERSHARTLATLNDSIDQRREEVASMREALDRVDAFDAERAVLQSVWRTNVPVIHAMRLLSDRMPSELTVTKVRIDDVGGMPQAVLDGFVAVEYRTGLNTPEPDAKVRNDTALEDVPTLFEGVAGIASVDVELVDQTLPDEPDDHGRMYGVDTFRIRVALLEELR